MPEWLTSATLWTTKPVNQSELSRNGDNTPNRLHIQDFSVVMFCRHTASCKCVLLAFAYIGEKTVVNYSYDRLHILLFCDCVCDICCVYHLEGLSNVYYCCYAWGIQNTRLILIMLNMTKYLWPRPNAWTQHFGTEAILASAIEANFAPYI